MEQTVVLEEKTLASCILASIPKAKLGKVDVKKTTTGFTVRIEITYPLEVDEEIKNVIKEFKDGVIWNQTKVLMSKYKFIDSIIRSRINQFKLNK